jgi:ketosteroid isomerase-like protein
MTMIDTEHRRLCNAFMDAVEAGDVEAVERCYAPDATLWFNVTGEEMSREDNLAGLVSGRSLHRRRTYDDRTIKTFDDGFVVQFTVRVVGHGGSVTPLSACLVAEVREGKITKIFEYLDSGKFGRR